jgi:hypothetical protein
LRNTSILELRWTRYPFSEVALESRARLLSMRQTKVDFFRQFLGMCELCFAGVTLQPTIAASGLAGGLAHLQALKPVALQSLDDPLGTRFTLQTEKTVTEMAYLILVMLVQY